VTSYPSPTPEARRDEPVELGDYDAIDGAVEEEHGLYDDEPQAMAPPRRHGTASSPRPKKKKRVVRETVEYDGPHPILAIGAGVIGLFVMLIGLVLVDAITLGIMILGAGHVLYNMRKLGLMLLLAIFGVSTWGLACLLRLIRPTAGTATKEGATSAAAGLVIILVLLTIGFRMYLGKSAPSLIRDAMNAADQAQARANRAASAPANPPAEMANEEQLSKLTQQLESDDLSTRMNAAENLARLDKSGSPYRVTQIQLGLGKLFNEHAKPQRLAAIRALARWGGPGDIPMFEDMKNEPDPDIAKAAADGLESVRARR
jgi:hypothetical protein